MHRLISHNTCVLLMAIITSASLAAEEEDISERHRDLQSMQGKWTLIEKESSFVVDHVIREYLPEYSTALKSVQVEGNRLQVASTGEVLVIGNCLTLEGVRVPLKTNHLICFTLQDGRVVLGNYRLDGDRLEIRIPETCGCTRSGITAIFARIRN